MAVHSLPLNSIHARWRLGDMLAKVRRRLHVKVTPAPDRQPIWLPESPAVHQLRQVFTQARRSQAQHLGELSVLLPMLDTDAPVAAAVLYRLVAQLESCEGDARSWQLNQAGLEALLGVLPPGQLHALLAYGQELLEALEPPVGLGSVGTETRLWSGLTGNSYLLAGLIGFAACASGRTRLEQLLGVQDDPVVATVRLPGRAPILTAMPTPTECLLLASAGAQGSWPALLEKAALSLWPQAARRADDGPGPLLHAALELFSGQTPENLDTALISATGLQQALQTAFAGDCVMIAASNQYPWLVPSLLPSEALAVTGFDQETVQLSRALGQAWPQTADGQPLSQSEALQLDIPLTEFAKHFSHLAWIRI